MAEINAGAEKHAKRAGCGKRSKLSTRIDLTPMVDLGFLLITFFLVTTTLAKPKVMTINMPYKPVDPIIEIAWPEGATMTILLSKHHRLYYYNGIGNDPSKPPLVKVAAFNGTNNIRDAILEKMKNVRLLKEQKILRSTSEATLLIKPDTNSTYEDFVQIMDELNIDDVKLKAVVDITATDQLLIATAKP